MKKSVLILITLLTLSINGFAQFGADYSSYGFNFINDTHNEGLKNWTGDKINNTNKFSIYKQDNQNNYALELKPVNETLSINYEDSGYMDLNPCSLKINIRVKINQYSGNNDNLTFLLFTGAKKVELEFTSNGIYYTNSANISALITAAATINQWITYSIALNNCDGSGTLMLENDQTNIYTLDFPNNTTAQNINLAASTDGTNSFLAEIDHLFIYSNPIKWWLGHSTEFRNDTPAGYVGTTGDRQHFLSLPNGERIGLNENGGGYITFTELTPGGPNLDPKPKFGSGGTKTLRGYFHSSDFNPVQAGISSVSGGHLVEVNATANKVSVESFPLHSFFQDDFTENTPLVYPSGDILEDPNHPAIIDDDVYDEFGLDMRDELMCELDFNTAIEDITRPNEISTVRHSAEWEFIRHPSHILQFHEVTENHRPNFGSFTGANNDMGEMRHKFEFRLNKDLGYEYILWIDENNEWQSFQVTAVGDKKELEIELNTAREQRFLVFSTSPDPDSPGAVAWYYPENDFNSNGTLGKSRDNKAIRYTEDRRTSVIIIADWRKTNWCRMNLYIRNEGLIAPPNGDPTIYEAFQMEALQFFGTPNEIFNEVINYDSTLPIDNDNDGFTSDVDCNDADASINANATEIPNNEIDEDCDGVALVIDNDNDGFNSDVDCNDSDASINGGATEIPNNDIDENCDGVVLVIDNDNDGFNSDVDCNDADATINTGATEIPNNVIDEDCDGVALIIDNDMDGYNSDVDCNDADASINTGATEIPNNEIDENCDGVVLVIDNDNDGFNSDIDCNDSDASINANATEIANNNIDEDCDGVALIIDNDMDGYNSDVDCNDADASINTGATEIPNNEIDENCDGVVLVIDNDNDGFNSDVDCNDSDASINANATEIANNNIDEDCDGVALIIDNDMDGYNSDVDCNDSDASINTGATEIPNNEIDENCDGVVLVIDNDNDGFNSDVDCNDSDASINANATEIANNEIDEDCDGVALVIDNDNDGFNSDVDCNDADASINTGATEIPNNEIDEDCDGEDLITSSIYEIGGNKLNIYPNPVQQDLFIEFNGTTKLHGRIIDIDGRILKEMTIQKGMNKINMNSLIKGMYLLNISSVDNHQQITDRIIKQ